MKVIITENPGNEVIAVIENWNGPLPRAGEYIYHPPFGNNGESNVMSVKTVTYRMLTRTGPAGLADGGVFVGHPEPYAEIHV